VVASNRLIPIQLGVLILVLRSKSNGPKQRGGRLIEEVELWRGAYWRSTTETFPAIPGGNEGTDEVKQATMSSEVRSASSIVSCHGAEGRLEAVRGVSDFTAP
jgi:hypothetical protein